MWLIVTQNHGRMKADWVQSGPVQILSIDCFKNHCRHESLKTVLLMAWQRSMNGGDLPPCREPTSIPAGCIIRGFHYFVREKSFLHVHVIRWISGIFFMSLHFMVKIFLDKWIYFSPLLRESIRTFILALCDFSNICEVELFLSQNNEVDESDRVFSAWLGSP